MSDLLQGLTVIGLMTGTAFATAAWVKWFLRDRG